MSDEYKIKIQGEHEKMYDSIKDENCSISIDTLKVLANHARVVRESICDKFDEVETDILLHAMHVDRLEKCETDPMCNDDDEEYFSVKQLIERIDNELSEAERDIREMFSVTYALGNVFVKNMGWPWEKTAESADEGDEDE